MKRKNKFSFSKHINGTKGVISLFLAIIMVPFTMAAGGLINLARINSAVAIYDEALCNASDSTLGTYDEFLRQRFGLLAISQDLSGQLGKPVGYDVQDLISDTFQKYMEENTKVLSNTYIVSETSAEGLYSLADPNILEAEIDEYSKFTVPMRLVADGISLDDLIKKWEQNMPFVKALGVFKSATDEVEKILTFAKDIEEAKTAAKKQDQAKKEYDEAYEKLKEAASGYSSSVKEEADQLAKIVEDDSQKNTSMESNREKIKELEKEIEELEKEQNKNKKINNKEKIDELRGQIDSLNTEIETITKELQESGNDYSTTKERLDKTVEEKKTSFNEAVDDYANKIKSLRDASLDVVDKVGAAKKSFNSMISGFTNVAATVVKTTYEKGTEAEQKSLDGINKQLADKNLSDEKKEELINQKSVIEENISNNGDHKAVVEASQKGVETGFKSINNDLNTIKTDTGSEIANKYNELYNKVLGLKLDDKTKTIPEDLSSYYIQMDNITLATIVELEKKWLKELKDNAIWGTLETMSKLVDSLFNTDVFFDGELAAEIDQDYYKDSYNGLPSQKNRNLVPLKTAPQEDATRSEEWKKIIGNYEAVTGGTDAEIMGACAVDILSEFSGLSGNIKKIQESNLLVTFAKRVIEIWNTMGRIFDKIKEFMGKIMSIIGNSGIYKYLLLSGYATYMTSNRTTYTDKNRLNGEAFNLRNQKKSQPVGTIIGDIDSFISMANGNGDGNGNGELEKCFVGAETEYLLSGQYSEIANQVRAFAEMFLVRMVINLPATACDSFVREMGTCFPPFSFIVFPCYWIIEGLLDTVFLANGEKIPLVKNFCYLTPRGTQSMMRHFTNLASLRNIDLFDVKKHAEEVGEKNKAMAAATGESINDQTWLDVEYTQMFLFLLAFRHKEIIPRLADIIEMEAVENEKNNLAGSDGLFDLDLSYTMLRAEAQFTTNQFIPISEKTGFTAAKRVTYRGY